MGFDASLKFDKAPLFSSADRRGRVEWLVGRRLSLERDNTSDFDSYLP